MWYVYIVQCSDCTLYCGMTNNVEARIKKHNKGVGAKYTKGRLPVLLLKQWEFKTKSEALSFEYKIKQLSRIKKLELAGVKYFDK